MRFPGSILKGCNSSKVSRHHTVNGSIYRPEDECLFTQSLTGLLYMDFERQREKEKARKTPSQCSPNLRHHIVSWSKLSNSGVNWLLALVTKISSVFPPPSICSGLGLEVPIAKEESLIPIASAVELKPINISLAGTLTLVPLNMLKKT